MRPTPQAPRTIRRRRSKGTWMRLQNPDLLRRYMENAGLTQSDLAFYAQRSRQFIHMLLKGERKTCQEAVAERIEKAVRVLPGTLFVKETSPTTRTRVAKKRTAA